MPGAGGLSKWRQRPRQPGDAQPSGLSAAVAKAAASGGAGNTGLLSNTGSWLPAALHSASSLTVPNMQCAFLSTNER